MDELRIALYELCRPYPDGDVDVEALGGLISSVERPDASLRERLSFLERVAFRLHDRLSCGAMHGEVLPGLALDDRRRALDVALGEIDEVVEREGLDVLALKGFAIEALYPGDYTRQFGDIDLLVEDAATAWRLVAELQDIGFSTANEPPLTYRLPGSVDAHVLVKLSRADGAKVEVASGAASNGPLPTGMPWGDLRRTSVVSPRCRSLRIPGPEATIALFLVELYERRSLFVRDLCDWDVLRRHLEEHGSADVLKPLIEALNLRPSLRRVNRESRAVRGLPRGPASRVAEGTRPTFRSWAWSVSRAPKGARPTSLNREWQELLGSRHGGWGVPGYSAYWWGYGRPFLARRLGRVGSVLAVVRGWLDYTLRRSRLPGADRLRLELETRIDPVARLRTPGLPVYLVRLGDAPAGMRRTDAPRWVPSAEGRRSLLATPAGVFLPSAYLTLREHDLESAQSVAEALTTG